MQFVLKNIQRLSETARDLEHVKVDRTWHSKSCWLKFCQNGTADVRSGLIGMAWMVYCTQALKIGNYNTHHLIPRNTMSVHRNIDCVRGIEKIYWIIVEKFGCTHTSTACTYNSEKVARQTTEHSCKSDSLKWSRYCVNYKRGGRWKWMYMEKEERKTSAKMVGQCEACYQR